MTTILKEDLITETTSEPMVPEDLLLAVAVSALKNGSVSWDEIAATCEAAGRGDIVVMAKELGDVEGGDDVDPAMDDPDPEEDPPTE